MIPVREGQNKLLVKHVGIWILWVVDDERTAEAVWVLPIDVRMVPVRAWLIDLARSDLIQDISSRLTVKL